MTLAFYFDEHVPEPLAIGPRAREIDVVTCQEDLMRSTDDAVLLQRAGELARILFTQDKDFLRLTADAHRAQQPFTGVVYSEQQAVPFAQLIDDLELIARCCTFDELQNSVVYIPLKAAHARKSASRRRRR